MEIIKPSSVERMFQYVFNDRECVPLVPSEDDLYMYNIALPSIDCDTLNPINNHALIPHLKNKKKIRCNVPCKIYDFKGEYKYFLLNAFRFGEVPNNKRNQIAEVLGISRYHKATFSSDIYGNNVVYDVRINYRYDNLPSKLSVGCMLIKLENPKYFFYIENLYYINRLRVKERGFKREKYLKNMKVPINITSEKAAKLNDFVDMNNFVELIDIMKKIAEKFYLTGSLIDYMNNTNFDPSNYEDSDIDIVIVDKVKFHLLAGYLLGYLTFIRKLDDIANYFTYDGKYISIQPGIFSCRPIQIYCMAEKYCVFAHHFPCVRGYVDHKMRMRLSNQAVDIFQPESDKIIKYVFIFPYTDVEKSKNIIKKYEKRGYIIN